MPRSSGLLSNFGPRVTGTQSPSAASAPPPGGVEEGQGDGSACCRSSRSRSAAARGDAATERSRTGIRTPRDNSWRGRTALQPSMAERGNSLATLRVTRPASVGPGSAVTARSSGAGFGGSPDAVVERAQGLASAIRRTRDLERASCSRVAILLVAAGSAGGRPSGRRRGARSDRLKPGMDCFSPKTTERPLNSMGV